MFLDDITYDILREETARKIYDVDSSSVLLPLSNECISQHERFSMIRKTLADRIELLRARGAEITFDELITLIADIKELLLSYALWGHSGKFTNFFDHDLRVCEFDNIVEEARRNLLQEYGDYEQLFVSLTPLLLSAKRDEIVITEPTAINAVKEVMAKYGEEKDGDKPASDKQ